MCMCWSLNKMLRSSMTSFCLHLVTFSWDLLRFCHFCFNLWKLICRCFYFWSFIEYAGCQSVVWLQRGKILLPESTQSLIFHFWTLIGWIYFFSSTPLYNSSDHEDFVDHLECSDHGCCDIFTHSFGHDYDSPIADLSKPLAFEDISSDEVETPQVSETLQPELMVMSSSRSLYVSPTSNKKYVESSQAPHSSLVHIENQSSSWFLHP